VDDLLHHIEQDLHLQSIMQHNLPNGLNKTIAQERTIQLLKIKSNLQIALLEYNSLKEGKK